MSARCGSCRAPIHWALSEATGARMPLDADAKGAPLWVDDGNVYLRGRTAAGVPIVAVLRKGQTVPDETPRYRAHFATCPHAYAHRNRRPGKPAAAPALSGGGWPVGEGLAPVVPLRGPR